MAVNDIVLTLWEARRREPFMLAKTNICGSILWHKVFSEEFRKRALIQMDLLEIETGNPHCIMPQGCFTQV